MSRRNFDFCRLQEVRWRGDGARHKTKDMLVDQLMDLKVFMGDLVMALEMQKANASLSMV